MNKVELLGRLTADPEVYGTGEKAVTKVTLAVDRDGETADFIRITAFGKTGEIIDQHCGKGDQIAVVGHIQTGSYEKDGARVYTQDVIVERMFFAGSKSQPKETPAAEAAPQRQKGESRKSTSYRR